MGMNKIFENRPIPDEIQGFTSEELRYYAVACINEVCSRKDMDTMCQGCLSFKHSTGNQKNFSSHAPRAFCDALDANWACSEEPEHVVRRTECLLYDYKVIKEDKK